MASSAIEKWADSIQQFEGWSPGSKSYRNNNPGNLRYSHQANARNDGNGFAKFETYEEGRRALIAMLTDAASGKSHIYKPTMSLTEFFRIYAPTADHNRPDNYAKTVADKVGVKPDTPISQLL
ncbi:MAG TPA: hypothetical protein VKB84_08800 [Candidatus Binataceae bacterium]|nr:hypothetical protein [Candidatus Binataceae bacterium]